MAGQFDRRTFLGRAAAVAAGAALLPAASILEACDSPTPAAATAAPRTGGSLTFATEAEINSFDPRLGVWDSSGLLLAATVYDPLFTQAANGDVRPFLARAITPNADYTQWTIALRPGVTFHDGTPLDATTVKVNLDESARSPLTGPYVLNMQGTKVIDSLTVLVTMYSPWVPFPIYLTRQLGFMAGLKQLADLSGRARPVGTGPYVFQEWLPGDHFTANRNSNYWRPGLPYLDSITYRPIVDPVARGNSLLAGNVDLMHSSDSQNVFDFRNRAGYNQVNDVSSVLGEPDQGCIMLNCAVPPLNDVRVRQALAYATDSQLVIDRLFNGLTRAAIGPFTPGSPYFDDTGYPEYSVARARALVAAYQRDSGPISFKFTAVNTNKGMDRNQLLQDMWNQVGIHTEIEQIEQNPLIADALTGSFQACGWRQFGCPDPDANFVWWSGTTALPAGKQSLNMARNRDAQIDAALEAGRTQVDPIVRAAAYKLVARRLGATVPYIWLGPSVWIVVGRASVGGIGLATLPDGSRARGMSSGIVPPGELWVDR